MCDPAEIQRADLSPVVRAKVWLTERSALQEPARARRSRVHRIHPALVTIATRPSVGWLISRIELIWGFKEAEYFLPRDWTGFY
jgi:hypothetical protein